MNHDDDNDDESLQVDLQIPLCPKQHTATILLDQNERFRIILILVYNFNFFKRPPTNCNIFHIIPSVSKISPSISRTSSSQKLREAHHTSTYKTNSLPTTPSSHAVV